MEVDAEKYNAIKRSLQNATEAYRLAEEFDYCPTVQKLEETAKLLGFDNDSTMEILKEYGGISPNSIVEMMIRRILEL